MFCMVYDGVDDYVEFPDDPALRNGGEITVAAWMKLYSDTGVYQQIAGKVEPGTEYRVLVRPNQVFWQLYDDAGNEHHFTCSASFEYYRWYWVVCSYSSSEGKGRIYVNGEKKTEADDSFVPKQGTAVFRIGLTWDENYPLHGKIDEVIVWNEVLSDQDILDLYRKYIAGPARRG